MKTKEITVRRSIRRENPCGVPLAVPVEQFEVTVGENSILLDADSWKRVFEWMEDVSRLKKSYG